MRTTIRLDSDLLARAKQFAARTHRSLTAVIEDALREVLARQTVQPKRARIRVPTAGGRGVAKGIDLDDSASLLEEMERTEG